MHVAAQGKIIIAGIITHIAMISAPALSIEAFFKPDYPAESHTEDDTKHSRKATCKRNATCSDTRPTMILASNEKSEASHFRAKEASSQLDQLPQDGVLDLMRALYSDEPQIRSHAAKALGHLGKAAEHAMPALLVAAEDNRSDVRADAIWAIGKVIPQDQAVDAVNVLTIALDDPSDSVRWSAAWSLARIGSAAEAAVPALIERLKDLTRKIRASAVSALTRVASQSSRDVIIPALAELKDDDDELVRRRAAEALRALKAVSDASPNP